MKILFVADHQDPLVYSNSIKERFKEVDIVFGLGDLDLSYYDFIVSSLNKPLYFIFGNHNLRYFNQFYNKHNYIPNSNYGMLDYELSCGSTCIEDSLDQLDNNLIVMGLGGSIRYNKGESQYSEFQMTWRIIKLMPKLFYYRIAKGRYLDVLITHAPPLGFNDGDDLPHRGFRCFLWFMKIFKPIYLVHGHVHLYDINQNREIMYHQTTVVNAYDHIVLDLGDDFGKR